MGTFRNFGRDFKNPTEWDTYSVNTQLHSLSVQFNGFIIISLLVLLKGLGDQEVGTLQVHLLPWLQRVIVLRLAWSPRKHEDRQCFKVRLAGWKRRLTLPEEITFSTFWLKIFFSRSVRMMYKIQTKTESLLNKLRSEVIFSQCMNLFNTITRQQSGEPSCLWMTDP